MGCCTSKVGVYVDDGSNAQKLSAKTEQTVATPDQQVTELATSSEFQPPSVKETAFSEEDNAAAVVVETTDNNGTSNTDNQATTDSADNTNLPNNRDSILTIDTDAPTHDQESSSDKSLKRPSKDSKGSTKSSTKDKSEKEVKKEEEKARKEAEKQARIDAEQAKKDAAKAKVEAEKAAKLEAVRQKEFARQETIRQKEEARQASIRQKEEAKQASIKAKQDAIAAAKLAKEESKRLKEQQKASKKKDSRKSKNDEPVFFSKVTNSYITITKDEQREINEAHEGFGKYFSYEELQRLYIRYKENNKCVSRDEFSIVYTTFSRGGDVSMAGHVFDLFDARRVGQMTFEEFVHFLAVVLKGTPRQRLEYCFRLFDHDGDGYITKQDLIDILTHLPVQKLLARRRDKMAKLLRTLTPVLLEPVTEDEESEHAQAEAERREAKQLEIERRRAQLLEQEQLVSEIRKGAGSPGPKTPKSPNEDPRNVNQARRVAEEVFDEAQCGGRITMHDFVTRVGACEALQAFFPF